VAVMRFLERRGVRRILEGALPNGRTSPNQIPVLDMVLAFFAGALTGSRRFAHVERLRSDEVVRTIWELARMPSATVSVYSPSMVPKPPFQLNLLPVQPHCGFQTRGDAESPRLLTLRTKYSGHRRHPRCRGPPHRPPPRAARPLAPTLRELLERIAAFAISTVRS
jgi:hypothetical protein